MVKTKRWNDPPEPDDGCRLLIARYRPRGVARSAEPWDAWAPDLAPSRGLHADAYGKAGAPIAWEEYRARYLAEMAGQSFWIRALGERVRRGETLTLLCSSACLSAERCHRSLLRELIEAESTRQEARREPALRVLRRRPPARS